MGEPFTASATGQDALASWFAQADRDHDGNLSLAEMQQDAARFFALLDLNRDGEIDPDEITRYETVVAPQIHTGAAATHFQAQAAAEDQGGASGQNADGGNDGGQDQGQTKGNLISAAPVGPEGAGRFGLLNIPEPVAAADTNFNRGVSEDEFDRAATERFRLLDTDHDGRLTLAQLAAQRL